MGNRSLPSGMTEDVKTTSNIISQENDLHSGFPDRADRTRYLHKNPSQHPSLLISLNLQSLSLTNSSCRRGTKAAIALYFDQTLERNNSGPCRLENTLFHLAWSFCSCALICYLRSSRDSNVCNSSWERKIGLREAHTFAGLSQNKHKEILMCYPQNRNVTFFEDVLYW